MNLELVLIGLLVGLLVGLTGVGGASIMTPLLIVALRINPLVAVGTDLLYSVPMKLLGAYVHFKQGTINFRIVGMLSLGGIPAVVVGLISLYWLRQHVDVIVIAEWAKRGIGVMLLISAVLMIVSPFILKRVQSTDAFTWPRGARIRVVIVGALVGFAVSLTSIGSGSVALPLLAMTLPMVALPELVGSDIAFAALLIPTAALGHWSMRDTNLPLALNLLAGALPGVYVGSKLCRRLEQRWLRPAVAVVLVFVGARLV